MTKDITNAIHPDNLAVSVSHLEVNEGDIVLVQPKTEWPQDRLDALQRNLDTLSRATRMRWLSMHPDLEVSVVRASNTAQEARQ